MGANTLHRLQLPPDQYEELKNFFSMVEKGDGGQTVFPAEGAEKAQSSN